MRSPSALSLSILALVSQIAAESGHHPTAIRKIEPGSSDKLFPHDLAFAPLPELSPREAAAAAISFLDEQSEELSRRSADGSPRFWSPAFAPHYDDGDANVARRAAEALAILERRQACPAGMSSCKTTSHPTKCCPSGSYCADVGDETVGGVACCPNGATCSGGVGNCPSGATSCSSELGGGCCIPGYVCQGSGCVPKASATKSKSGASKTVVTSTMTTQVNSKPKTVVVTLTITKSRSSKPKTHTRTRVVTASDVTAEVASSGTRSASGEAPFRAITSTARPASSSEESQTGCPTGYYGCLARHGGGCCRTDRDCNTFDCPVPSRTIVSDHATIVLLATDAPPAEASSTCASGWLLCGKSAGPVAGCCPKGYSCGTASCFTAQASSTGAIEKKFPEASSAAAKGKPAVLIAAAISMVITLLLQ